MPNKSGLLTLSRTAEHWKPDFTGFLPNAGFTKGAWLKLLSIFPAYFGGKEGHFHKGAKDLLHADKYIVMRGISEISPGETTPAL